METTETGIPTVIHTGPIMVELSACIQCVQATREALAEAAELCKMQWGYENNNLAYLVEQAFGRLEEYLLTSGKLISEASPEHLRSVLARLQDDYDSIGGRRLTQWYARNLKDLLTKQQSFVVALNKQLQDALASEQPDAEICLAIMSALEREHARQASTANLWGAALSYMEQAYRHYSTVQRLVMMHAEKPAPESAG